MLGLSLVKNHCSKLGSSPCTGHLSAFPGCFSNPPPEPWSTEIPATRCHFLFLLKLMAPGVLPYQSFTFGQGAVIPAIVGITVSGLKYKAGTAFKRREYQTSKFNLSVTTLLCLKFKHSRTAGSVSVTGYWPREVEHFICKIAFLNKSKPGKCAWIVAEELLQWVFSPYYTGLHMAAVWHTRSCQQYLCCTISADFTGTFQLWKGFEIEMMLPHLVLIFFISRKVVLLGVFQELPNLKSANWH